MYNKIAYLYEKYHKENNFPGDKLVKKGNDTKGSLEEY